MKNNTLEVKMKKLYGVMMVVIFVAFATTVFAFGPKGSGFGYRGHTMAAGFGPGMYANLNLAQEQQDKMWQAKEKFRNETSATRYELFKKRAELRNLIADPNANEATILAKEKELNALRQTLHEKAVQYKLAQRKILTPEQIKKIGETGYGYKMGRGRGAGADCYGFGAGLGAGPRVQ